MSYILDALKKSDKQRHQEHVPDLNTVQLELPPAKMKKASWPLPLAAIVLVNVIFILFFIFHQDQSTSETQSVIPNADRSQSTPGRSPVSQEPLPLSADLITSVDNDIEVRRQEDDAALGLEETFVEAEPEPDANDSAEETVQKIVPEVRGTLAPQEDFDLTTELESAEAATPAEEYSGNSVFDLSKQTRYATPADSSLLTPNPSSARTLHIYQLPEIIRQQLPEIHIDAHLFYKNKPSARFASINGKIMREGYILAPDLKVAEITTDGVIFSYQKYLFYVPVF